jgi:hypothetical protein
MRMEFHFYYTFMQIKSARIPFLFLRNTSGENWGIPIGQKENIAVFFKNTFFIPLATRD